MGVSPTKYRGHLSGAREAPNRMCHFVPSGIRRSGTRESDRRSLTRLVPPELPSNRQLLAALAAARGKNGAAGPGAHPLAEAVDLGPPTVVRLERTLAHWNSRSFGRMPSIKSGHVIGCGQPLA